MLSGYRVYLDGRYVAEWGVRIVLRGYMPMDIVDCCMWFLYVVTYIGVYKLTICKYIRTLAYGFSILAQYMY